MLLNVLILNLLALGINCWGFLGHQITAAVAQHYLKPSVQDDIVKLLRGKTIVEVATWADTIKRDRKYSFSRTLHYSNPKTNEPYTCGYDYRRDCPDAKCVVGAIHNYTDRAVTDSTRADREDALKFLVHYIGDIHQPLHLSGRERGGNNARCTFFGAKANLHFVWDSMLLEKRYKTDFGKDFDSFVEYLIEQIEGDWQDDADLWTSCSKSESFGFVQQAADEVSRVFNLKESDVTAAKKSKFQLCPELWAKQSNKLDCTNVWRGFEEDMDIGEEYYNDNIEAVERQLAAGGVRLAYNRKRVTCESDKIVVSEHQELCFRGDQISIMSDPKDSGCEMMDTFAIVLQGFLAIIALSTLYFKRYKEKPKRPFNIWLFDAAKQASGAFVVHMLNVLISYIFGGVSEHTKNPCVFYFINVLLDTTVAVFILFFFLRLMDRIVSYYDISDMQSGVYGQPPQLRIWVKQTCGFIACLFATKIVVIILLQFDFLTAIGAFFVLPITDPRAQLVVVMLLFPLVMNIFQFWLVDSYIRNKLHDVPRDNSSSSEVYEALRSADEEEAIRL